MKTKVSSSSILKAFVVNVALAALALLVAMPKEGLVQRPGALLALLALAGLAGTRPVRIPGLKLDMAPIHPFIFVAIAAFGPMAAALTGIAGVAGAAIGRPRRPAPIQFTFNLGAMVLASATASWFFLVAGGEIGGSALAAIGPLCVATVAFFLANTGLVTGVIALEKRQGFFETWRETFSWSFGSYLVGLAFSIPVLAVIDTAVAWCAVLVIPACKLLVKMYQAQASTRLSSR